MWNATRAAETAVSELDHAAVKLLLRAKAAAADQIAIDPHLAKFIHQNGQPQATGQQQLAQHGQ